jgi:nucleoside-diphosphate-sugar epimerase
MKVVVAGATGDLGALTVRRLVQARHEVLGLTRYADKREAISHLGAAPVLGDVMDAAQLRDVMADEEPDAVLALANALPTTSPRKVSDLDATNALRTVGTANLIAAAATARCRRFVAESFIAVYGFADHPTLLTERDPIGNGVRGRARPIVEALVRQHDLVVEATRQGIIDGVLLRMGGFYGPQAGYLAHQATLLRRRMLPLPGGGQAIFSFIHLEDAADAVLRALERGRPGECYNIVDDEPVRIGEFLRELARIIRAPQPMTVPLWMSRLGGDYLPILLRANLPVSNAKAKTELGWPPRYSTFREGLKTVASVA